jgi:signal transduction histidine kinase
MSTHLEVLLVEDNPGDANLIQEIMSAAAATKFHFTHVARLSEAIRHFKQNDAELALLDLGLPDSCGLETLRSIRRAVPWIPIVVLTGNNDERLGLEALKSGAQDYLIKEQVSGDLLIRVARYAVERHRSQMVIQENERFLKSTLNALSALIVIIDGTGRILAVNRAWREYVQDNVGRMEAVSEGQNYLKICRRATGAGREDAVAIAAGVRSVMFQGKKLFETEYACHRGDSKRWFHCRATPFRDNGNFLVVVAHEDISPIKLAQEDLIRSEKRFRQVQKIESLGTLAGGIAHDFNNILSAINGFSELAMEKAKADPSQLACLREIHQAGMRASDLVRQILTFSRKSNTELKPLCIDLVVKEAMQLLRSTLPTSIEIKKRIQTRLDPIMADPTQVHQIIMNLCTNASHAMEPDGGTLAVMLTQETPDTAFFREHLDMRPGDYLKLTLSDTGCGMTPEVLSSIFDPYFTTKDLGEGTGLGLSVVHGIVKDHGGAIEVQSEPGVGTTFTLYFPTVQRKTSSNGIDSGASLPGGEERILLIDDEPSILRLNRSILRELGYRVSSESDSQRALEQFRATPEAYDLIHTDMTMPKLTGDRLAKSIRSIRQDIPIILSTGYNRKMDESQAKKLGIDLLMMKPVSRKVLAKEIRRLLDERSGASKDRKSEATILD